MGKESTAKEDTNILLSKSKIIMDFTYIVVEDNQLVLDDGWIERLWVWADENHISNEDLPRDKYKLLSLESLDWGGEEGDGYCLDELPEEIGMLPNLTFLSFCVNGNSCRELPETLGKLTNLSELLIYVCSHHDGGEVHIPKSMADLTELILISLTGNISTESIGLLLENCESLSRLFIDNNPILKTLPKNISHCSSMRELVLTNNRNLLLTQKQFAWAINLRDEEEGWKKEYCFTSPGDTLCSYTSDYGQKFRYYSITPFDRSKKLPKPNFPSEEELIAVDCE